MKTAKLFACSLLAVTMFAACEEDPGQDKVLYTVTVTSDENGTATASAPEAEAGAEVTLTAVPAEGYIFDKWTVVEGSVTIAAEDVTKESIVITMPAENISVSASFVEEKVPHAINITEPENGTIAVTDDLTEALSGETVEVTATPAEGFDFVKWTVTGVDVAEENLTANPLSFVMPDAEVTIAAEFKEIVDVIAAVQDEVFKAFLVYHRDNPVREVNPLTGEESLTPAWDTNLDGILSDREAAEVKIINLYNGYTSPADEYGDSEYEDAQVYSLSGLEYFTGLEVLSLGGDWDTGYSFGGNTEDIDFSAQVNLKYLNLHYCDFWDNAPVLGNKPELEYMDLFYCWVYNPLDLSQCPKLNSLDISGNYFGQLDITGIEATSGWEFELEDFSYDDTDEGYLKVILRADQQEAFETDYAELIDAGSIVVEVKE